MGSAATAVTTHRRGENLLLVFSYLIRAASLRPFSVPSHNRWCHPHQGLFFVCETDAYSCLPVNWLGICTLAFLTPQLNIFPNTQTLTVPLAAHRQSKGAIQLICLLVGLGITAGKGMGIGKIALSTAF